MFYETLFKQNSSKNNVKKQEFLNSLDTKTLANQQSDLLENEIRETDIFDSMKSTENNKTPGNNELTKEFYETFWDELKTPSMEGINRALYTKIISFLQMQAVIKLIEKEDRDKRYVKIWRPISLLNVDTKILSKAISKKLKVALPKLFSPQQTAYLKNRFIGGSGRLMSDITEISGWLNNEAFLVTMDIEKAFDSLDHDFASSVLRKFGFGKNFITWTEILLKDQLSCVINGGRTTQYFNLERGACQDDPISAYLFMLTLEFFFFSLKNISK